MNIKEKQLARNTLIVVSIVFVAAILVLKFDTAVSIVVYLLNSLSPLFVGLIMALILDVAMVPIEKLLQKKLKKTRGLALTLTYLLTILVITLIIIFVMPQFFDSVITLANNLTKYIASISNYLNELLDMIGSSYRINGEDFLDIPVSDIANSIIAIIRDIPTVSDFIKELMPGLFSDIGSIAASMVSLFVNVVISFMFSIYLLLWKENIISKCQYVLETIFSEKVYQAIERVITVSNEVFRNFIAGLVTEMGILSLMFLIVMSIAGMPYSILIAVFTGFTSVIPYFGAWIATLFGAVLVLADAGIVKAIVFVIIFFIIQEVENNLIYPNVVGQSVGISPILVLVALAIFGDVLGIMGYILAVPIMAIIYILFKDILDGKKKKVKQEVKNV